MLSYLVTWTILKKKKATQTVCFQVVVSKQNLFASELELVVRAKKIKKKNVLTNAMVNLSVASLTLNKH